MSDYAIKKAAREINKAIESIGDQRITDITRTHSMIAGAIGLIPIPVVGIPCVIGNIYTMYGRINARIGIKFSENILKSIGGMIVSNLSLGIAGIGGSAVCNLIKFIPFIGTTIGAIGEVSVNYACTSVACKLYCEWLKALSNSPALDNNGNIDEARAKDVMSEVIHSSNVNEMIKDAKKESKNIDFTKYKSEAQQLIDKEKGNY